MAFKHRSDGVYVRDLPPFKKLFPYIMATRTESAVYSSQKVEATALLEYLEKRNAGKSEAERIKLFHVFLAAIARTLKLRPELNRFIVGKRLYAHRDISITFVAKKENTEEAPEAEVRMVFSGTETLDEVRERVAKKLSFARSDAKGDDDNLIDLVGNLPRPVINFVAWLIRALDYHNVLPGFLMKAIPLYTSCYLANLGSIGLGAPFHHLYEWGSASLFLVIGRIKKEAMVDEATGEVAARDCVELAFTIDERVSEGFNHAKSILALRALILHPELLERGDATLEEILAAGESGA